MRTRSLPIALVVLAVAGGAKAAPRPTAPAETDYALLEPRSAAAVADSTTQATVRWKAPQVADGVAGYVVSLNGEEVARTKSLTYAHKGLPPGRTHLFRVAACNADGAPGRPSKIAEATTGAEDGEVMPLESVGVFERGRDVLITWWTKERAAGRVEHGPTEKLGRTAAGADDVRVHVVRLKGLEPETTWFARIVSTGARGRRGASAVFKVRTGRAPHSILTRLDDAKRKRLVLPGDFVYRGAFRPPARATGGSRWGYGGTGLTYCPTGDPDGADDGHPGSLFGIGHGHHDKVSEISIPAPVVAADRKRGKLPEARTLQPFADITGGLKARHKFDDAGGLAWIGKRPGQDADRIYWSFYIYYAVQSAGTIDHPAFGRSSLDLARPDARGLWHVGPYRTSAFHPKKTANYMFDAPRKWADDHAGRLCLVTGKGDGCGNGGTSHGPSMVAFGPWTDGSPPPDRAALTAKVLVTYPPKRQDFPYWSPSDAWTGGAWLTAGEKSAVLICGRRALGERYYGKPRPGDGGGGKGYHGTPYEAQFLLYDPADLEAVLAGRKRPREVLPYAVFRPREYLWGGGRRLGAAAFDRRRSVLYVFEPLGERPLIHVFAVAPT